MKSKPSVFRSYDIRGKYPQEINNKFAYQLGQAFLEFVKKRLKKEQIEIIVGRDNRWSSTALFDGLTQGILERGANVISLGVCTTPMFYWTVSRLALDEAGIMITASHLPKDYNGFKLVDQDAIPIDLRTGLKELKETMGRSLPDTEKKGKIVEKDALPEYVEFALKDFKSTKFLPFKIIIDTGNGVVGKVIPEFFPLLKPKIKLKVSHLFPELDADFPNRPPDSLAPESIQILQEEVRRKDANLGISFDGDGDRIILVDENGQFIQPDLILALLSELILKENPGAKIIYTVRASRIVPETINKNKGVPVISRVGHSHIKRKMKQENILFGGETSGHYYHRDHYFSEAPFFVLFKLLELMSLENKKLSELVKPLDKYHSSGEINFSLPPKISFAKIAKKIEEKYPEGKISRLDGLSICFDDWWLNLRHSQTEPVLRLVIEAKSKKLLEAKQKEIKRLFKVQP